MGINEVRLLYPGLSEERKSRKVKMKAETFITSFTKQKQQHENAGV